MANGAISHGRPRHGKEIWERSHTFGEQKQAVSGAVNKDIVGREQTRLLGDQEEEAGSKRGWPEQAVNESSEAHTWWEREQQGEGKAEASREVLRVADKEDKTVGPQGKVTMGQEYSKWSSKMRWGGGEGRGSEGI